MMVKPIRDGFHSVTPYLVIRGVGQLIKFLQQAFEAHEVHRKTRSDGTITHAQVRIGDSMVMMGEARGEFKFTPGMIYLYVSNADATYQRALKAGAVSLRKPVDEPSYGDRVGGVKDPTGNQWWIATPLERL